MRISARDRLRRLATACLLYSLLPIAGWLRPVILEDRFPICFFRVVTDKPCPFCGMTRAFAHLMHGDFGAAWESNPLSLPVAVGVLAFATLQLVDGLAGLDVSGRFMRVIHRSWLPVVLALSAFGLYRLIR